ncbi:hypothetical protein ACLB2K_063173 [Fragaria x ananassa]
MLARDLRRARTSLRQLGRQEVAGRGAAIRDSGDGREEEERCWNEDSLLLQLKDGLPDDMEVLYIGSLRVHLDPIDQEDVSHILLDEFKCVPTFLPPDIMRKFYDGFCKKHLWPLFHYMMPFSAEQGGRFDRSLWEAYISANK